MVDFWGRFQIDQQLRKVIPNNAKKIKPIKQSTSK